ncbi:hypothetical protein RchiOBHm_Chr1g0356451 [Rosa chinensis]|uniref:Uncharacterized protein n=1 Tax=Rosa chinensis TaxID=74649 RepID=A0A2P6SHN0_ROSCH|nr:hypothetical protein RchiOBHm_Chr1g0356451 [Rosa chinensis]
MGQEILTNLRSAAERLVEDGVIGDPGRDDEAAFRAGFRVHQALTRRQTDSGIRNGVDMVAEIATKWSKVLRTGSIGVRFMGVDMSTIMVTMERGQDMAELKEFVLNQPEAYEIKIGDQVFRRPGDPPLDQVVEKLQNERTRIENDGSTESNRQVKEELYFCVTTFYEMQWNGPLCNS